MACTVEGVLRVEADPSAAGLSFKAPEKRRQAPLCAQGMALEVLGSPQLVAEESLFGRAFLMMARLLAGACLQGVVGFRSAYANGKFLQVRTKLSTVHLAVLVRPSKHLPSGWGACSEVCMLFALFPFSHAVESMLA